MPDIIIYIALVILGILSIATFAMMLGESLEFAKVFVPCFTMFLVLVIWLVTTLNSERIVVKVVDASISQHKTGGQIHTAITFIDLNNQLKTISTGYINPESSVKVTLYKQMYNGILFLERPILIEVTNGNEVQSSEYKIEKIDEGERPQGLLSE